MTAGQKIYNLRERGGITQTAFAQAIGVDLETVQMWENGTLPVDISSAVLLSKAFCVDPGYFDDDKQFPDAQLYGDANDGSAMYLQPADYCHDCGLPMYDDAKMNKRSSGGRGSYTYYICGLCADKEAERKHKGRMRDRASLKKRFKGGLIASGIISGAALIATIVLCIIYGQAYIGLGVSLGIVIFLFPFIAQLPMDGFIFDAAMWALTGPILHLPATIFGFEWGDNIFGIVIKAIISFFSLAVYAVVAVGAVAFVLIASPFTLGPCMSRCIKEMKRTD